MTESRLTKAFLRVATVVVLVFVYTPLVLVAVYAFNPTIAQTWPPAGFTLEWFATAFRNPQVLDAFWSSIIAATFATGVALVLGTLASLAVQRYSFFGRETVSLLLLLPIALPGVVTGIALSATFQTLDVRFGLATVILGHATFCVVIAYNNVLARLRRTPRSFEEASADLGADTWTTFRRITMPALRTALLAGGLLAFALSFDEVIVTNFTAGPATETIPLFIFRSIQRPNQLPVVNVVALVLVLLSVIPVYLAQRISGDERGAALR
jgi:putative spermidine/putrescine transport system permease protein